MIELIHKAGALLIGTSDSKTALYDENGLDVEQILMLKKEKKSLTEYV